jgi:hypothetical protein
MADAEAETGATAISQSLILIVSAMLLIPALQFRPQLIDFVFLSAIIAILTRHNYRGSAPIWIVIPIVALWSNLHGGFFLGVVATGAYGAVTVLQDLIADRPVRNGMSIIAVAILAALSTLCTFLIPPAHDTWHALLRSVMNPMTREMIIDWRPLITTFRNPQNILETYYYGATLVLFAVTAIAVILTPRRRDLRLIAVAALMMAAAFVAVRNVPCAIIAIAPVLARHLGPLARRDQSRSENPVGASAPRSLWFITQGAIVAAAILLAHAIGLFTPEIPVIDYPAAAMDFINRNGLTGNILADFGWGQYVLWHMPAGSRVFIDTRYDLAFPSSVVAEYLTYDRGHPEGVKFLSSYPHDLILVHQDSKAAHLIDSHPAWTRVYSDPLASIYVRSNSAAAKIAPVTVSTITHRTPFP